jgi:integrase
MNKLAVLSDYRAAPGIEAAVESFFVFKSDLSPNTEIAYRQALGGLVAELGGELGVDQLHSELVLEVFRSRWGESKPNTWNTHLIAVRSFVAYLRRRGWIEEADDPLGLVDRRRVKRDASRAIHYDDLEALWSRRDVHLREKTFWKMLYETSARAREVLALDVPDLDLRRKEARIVGKGGDIQRIRWASRTARLLARYLAGRQRGPLFLTLRRPSIPMPDRDVCPETGRARISYDYAAKLFKEHSGGWTLHQLRHSSLTHLAAMGANSAQLQAKSRHRNRNILETYTKLGDAAVNELTSWFDEAGRRQ